MNKEEKEDVFIGCLIVGIAVSILTIISVFYYSIYHLLEKLIDKI